MASEHLGRRPRLALLRRQRIVVVEARVRGRIVGVGLQVGARAFAIAPADAKTEPYLAALEDAAALSRKPGLPCDARAKAEADYRQAHAAALGAPPRFESLSTSQRARLTRALDALVDAAMECRPASRRAARAGR